MAGVAHTNALHAKVAHGRHEKILVIVPPQLNMRRAFGVLLFWGKGLKGRYVREKLLLGGGVVAVLPWAFEFGPCPIAVV